MTDSQIVAALRLPLPLLELGEESRRLTRTHGRGLTTRQYGQKLLVATPGDGDPLGCPCLTCEAVRREWFVGVEYPVTFVVCPDCGNKRCPKANLHSNPCTGSNEPGQPGSAYE